MYNTFYFIRRLTKTTIASAWSAGSSDLYTSSRALYGLAKTGQAPKIFARVWYNLLLISRHTS